MSIDIPVVVSKMNTTQKIESSFATVRVGGEEFSEEATLKETADGNLSEDTFDSISFCRPAGGRGAATN